MGKVVNKLKSLVNNKQIKEYINMEKKIFTDKETTREEYLKFKEFIKSDAYKDHSMLYSGRWGVSGGDMTESYVIPAFKNAVIKVYNKYADQTEE